MLIFFKFFQNLEEETLPNSFYEIRITKAKDNTRKLQANISDKHGWKKPQKN